MADIFDVAAERIISQGRLVLCALSLLAVQLDPTQPEGYARAAFWLLGAYSGFAAILAITTLFRPLDDPRSRILIHAIDLAAISGLLWLTSGSTSPFFAFFTFILLAATMRWDSPAVILTAVFLALIFLLASLAQPAAPSPVASDDFDLNRTIIRGTYLLVIGAMLAYVSAYRARSHERLLRLAHWSTPSKPDEPGLARVLAHAATVLETSRVLVIWDEGEEPDLNLALWANGAYRRWREISGAYERSVPRELRHHAFMSSSPDSLLVRQEEGTIRAKPPLLDARIVSTFQVRSFSTAPLTGTICKGRVFILDGKNWSDDHLLLTEILAARICAELDREVLMFQAEQATIVRERARFTRDLHDGLLQSLTAAGLHLKVLGDSVNEQVRSRLESIRELLSGEQRRIRSSMHRTEDRARTSEFQIERDLGKLLEDPARLWNCEIALQALPPSAIVPASLGIQLAFILTEAVANAARHGGASRVDATAKLADGFLDLTIRDNGRGFSEAIVATWDPFADSEKLAPVSIRSRVSDLGGTLHIINSPQGAELQIRLAVT